MKFTIAASILLSSSAPAATGFAPIANFRQRMTTTIKSSSPLLAYAPEQQAATTTTSDVTIAAPWMLATETVDDDDDTFINFTVEEEDSATATLRESLGFTEAAVRQEYSDWLMQYGKLADASRYPIYKKNFLMQEEYNQKVGAAFTLNEYGDMTEQEFREMKANSITSVKPPAPKEPEVEIVAAQEPLVIEEEEVVEAVIEEEEAFISAQDLIVEEEEEVVAVVEEQEQLIIEEDTVVLEEPAVEIEAEEKVEIIDETQDFIEDVEERAFAALKDMDFVQPAPEHFSFSYVDGTPELKLESGSSYMDALHNPELSGLEGAGAMSGYLSSMPASGSSTFEEGKSGETLGASMNHLEDICDMLEPFMDCNKEARTPITITSPVEDAVYEGAARLKSLGDKAFKVLVELCSIGRCERV